MATLCTPLRVHLWGSPRKDGRSLRQHIICTAGFRRRISEGRIYTPPPPPPPRGGGVCRILPRIYYISSLINCFQEVVVYNIYIYIYIYMFPPWLHRAQYNTWGSEWRANPSEGLCGHVLHIRQDWKVVWKWLKTHVFIRWLIWNVLIGWLMYCTVMYCKSLYCAGPCADEWLKDMDLDSGDLKLILRCVFHMHIVESISCANMILRS